MAVQTSSKVHERRFRITLWKLELKDNKLERVDKELCELVQTNVSYSLNTIPLATVVPSLGDVINNDFSTSLTLKKIFELAKDRIPVGVYLQITHSFDSDGKKDTQYWPETKQNKQDDFGQYEEDYICIFKGYLQPPNSEISAYGAVVSFYVEHWLSALSTFSLMTPFSHLSNPADLSLQLYDFVSGNTNGNTWNPLSLGTVNDVWKDAIQVLFNTVINQVSEKYAWNAFSEDCRKRIVLAINNIFSNDNLKFMQLDLKDNQTIGSLIALQLQDDAVNRKEYCNTGAWDKLVGYYGSMFLFSLVPRVSDALLIPTPCTIDKDNCIEISNNEIFSIVASPVSRERISRVICTVPTVAGDNAYNAIYGNLGEYPKASEQTADGVIRAINYPTWITSRLVVPKGAKRITFYQEPTESISEIKETQEQVLDVEKQQQKLGDAYAKHAYLMNSFNSTSTTITVPVRMDICPGAMVHATASDLDLYGTVMSVNVSLKSGSNPPTTQIELINIRDSESVKYERDNPKGGAGYYLKQWTGKTEEGNNEVLYDAT